jgi:hypothetical protein
MWVDDAMVASLDAYSAVTLNAAGYAGGGAWLAGPDAEVVSTDADWGSYGTNDNTPDDLAYGDNTPVLVEGKATFDCYGDGTGCPTGGTTTTTN